MCAPIVDTTQRHGSNEALLQISHYRLSPSFCTQQEQSQ